MARLADALAEVRKEFAELEKATRAVRLSTAGLVAARERAGLPAQVPSLEGRRRSLTSAAAARGAARPWPRTPELALPAEAEALDRRQQLRGPPQQVPALLALLPLPVAAPEPHPGHTSAAASTT